MKSAHKYPIDEIFDRIVARARTMPYSQWQATLTPAEYRTATFFASWTGEFYQKALLAS